MVRLVLAAAAALVVLPGDALAQAALIDSGNDGVRLRVTPFFAYAPSATRNETRFIEAGLDAERYDARFELGAGFGGGLNVEYIFREPITVYAGGAFVRRDDSREFSQLEGGVRPEAGSSYIMARAGVGMRLREAEDQLQLRRLGASIFAGPTYIRELPRADVYRTQASGMNIFGVNFGLDAEVPLGASRFSLNAALEDNLVWWPNAELGRRNDSVYGSVGLQTRTTVETGGMHLWMLRFGITYKP